MPNSPPKHNAGRSPRDRRTAHERGYDHAWAQVRDRRRVLSPFCVRCDAEENLVTPVEIVDHILPVTLRPDLRLAIDNTQSLCRRHHAIKTEEDARRFGPAERRATPSGKSAGH